MTDTVSEKRGTDWTQREVDRCVEVYFDHLTMDLKGLRFNKEALYRSLSQDIGRTPASVSMKFQNISAVLDRAGREYIRGLPPFANYQELLAESVGKLIGRLDEIPILSELNSSNPEGLSEMPSFMMGAPPAVQTTTEKLPAFMREFIQKFDPVTRDANNRALGEAGEKLVLEYEKEYLRLNGRTDLSDNVRWVSKVEGNNAGYDILSFDPRGQKKFIEVKTTTGNAATPFFLSRNELQFNQHNAENCCLARIYDFRRAPQGFEIKGPLEGQLYLSPESYRATPMIAQN